VFFCCGLSDVLDFSGVVDEKIEREQVGFGPRITFTVRAESVQDRVRVSHRGLEHFDSGVGEGARQLCPENFSRLA
jgi:hypothetical protein